MGCSQGKWSNYVFTLVFWGGDMFLFGKRISLVQKIADDKMKRVKRLYMSQLSTLKNGIQPLE